MLYSEIIAVCSQIHTKHRSFQRWRRLICRSEQLIKTASRRWDSQVLKTPFCVPADVTTVARTVYKLVNRKGEEFLDVEDVKWTIGAGNCHIQFNNLFGGDKILGKTVVLRV